MNKGGDNKSTTTTSVPANVQAAQDNLLNYGNSILSPFLQQPAFAVAGFTPDQLTGMDWVRDLAESTANDPYKFYEGWNNYVGEQGGSYKPFDAAQVSGADIEAMLSPYKKNVVDTTVAAMDRDYLDKDAALSGQYAARSAFSGSGSGEALAKGQLARGYGETKAKTVADLMDRGYSEAQAAAMANAQMRQAAAQTNAAQAAASSDARLERGMRGLALGSSLKDADLQRKLAVVAQYLGIGGTQQQQAQNALNVPRDALSFLKGLVPMATGSTSTTTTPNNSASPLAQILGIGLTLAGMPMAGTAAGVAGGSVGGNLLGKLFK